MTKHFLAGLMSVLAVTGCGAEDTPADSGGAGSAEACDEAAIAACVAGQRTCVPTTEGYACESCPEGEGPATDGTCAKLAGNMLENQFDTQTLEPGFERDNLCQSWTLNNDDEIWVNAVEFISGGGYHHSNWLFVPDDQFDGPDGAWDCADREYSEIVAAVSGGVLYAQATQVDHELQRFPKGVALRLPPRTRIIGGTHVFNTTTTAIVSPLRLRLYEVEKKSITVPLTPFRMNNSALTIPAKSKSEFRAECDFEYVRNAPLDIDLYYAMPHYHSLGDRFRLELLGGERDGEAVFDHQGEPRGYVFDPPVSLSGAKGLTFSCGYNNPRSEEVGFGIGDQEMCVMLGFARSDYIFDAAADKTVDTSAGQSGTRFDGKCTVIGIPYSQTK